MTVRELGYVVIDATDLDAWSEFAVDLLGLGLVEDSPERLLLRVDDYHHRIEIRRAEENGPVLLGWAVDSSAALRDLHSRLVSEGYHAEYASPSAASARHVKELVVSRDPDGSPVESFVGLEKGTRPFVSARGARFVTEPGGLGHVFQFVSDESLFQAYYCDLLGFHISDYVDRGSIGLLTFAHCNSRHHSVAWSAVPGQRNRIGHLMIEVDDLDVVGRAWDRVVAGAAPIFASFGRHSNDHMLSFYAKSPSGFAVEYGFGGSRIDCSTWMPSRLDDGNLWGHILMDPTEPDV